MQISGNLAPLTVNIQQAERNDEEGLEAYSTMPLLQSELFFFFKGSK